MKIKACKLQAAAAAQLSPSKFLSYWERNAAQIDRSIKIKITTSIYTVHVGLTISRGRGFMYELRRACSHVATCGACESGLRRAVDVDTEGTM